MPSSHAILPCPQVSYAAFPTSSFADWIDYIVVDDNSAGLGNISAGLGDSSASLGDNSAGFGSDKSISSVSPLSPCSWSCPCFSEHLLIMPDYMEANSYHLLQHTEKVGAIRFYMEANSYHLLQHTEKVWVLLDSVVLHIRLYCRLSHTLILSYPHTLIPSYSHTLIFS
jgi:hypothetical protein